ncbi:V-type ATP synthase subunit A [Candidatus Woesearchaeota archaeon]|nr:V-type ATP synthase subunit A [Candidatus Woesearchaeota archaeon]
MKPRISVISGPVVVADNMAGAKMYDVVRVGKEKLLGEIIQLDHNKAIIQVYEETTGLAPGEPVENTGMPLSVELGPGMLKGIYDGVARPLSELASQSGNFIARGIQANSIDHEKKWDFKPVVKSGDEVKEGDILGTIQETTLIEHRILVPEGVSGKVSGIKAGKFTVKENICKVGKDSVQMSQKWSVRRPRKYEIKHKPSVPLVTGRRIFDTFFPIVKGGTAAIPGPFGAGKTVTQQDLAKWCDAEIIVYIGCGERGNEMTEVLTEFPELTDPNTGKPLIERTIMIANTSNMPVAAREASIYTGITIAEYFRDQGYNVALMADSTSRWAEAMREISSRLEEMPGEEGYPAYLASRLAQFYERAGLVTTLNGNQGSVSVIGAVSPPGGDFSEPVTQNTLRVTKVFWALDAPLAYRRHFPAINWLTSYSLYSDILDEYYDKNVSKNFNTLRRKAMQLLQKEAELQEIVQLVGPDALPEDEKAVIYITKSLREDYLQQNSFHEVDAYCSMSKQNAILELILWTYDQTLLAIKDGIKVSQISALPVNEKIARVKYDKDAEKEIDNIRKEFESAVSKLEGSL